MKNKTGTGVRREVMRACWPGAVLCGLLACAAAAQNAPMPLASFREVLELPRAFLTNKPPVHVRAVVTCADHDFNLIFLQDHSAGIFLYRHTAPTLLAVGDFVEVLGVAASGLHAPIIDRAQIRVLGRTNLPPARSLSIAGLHLGAPVGDLIAVVGVVQRVEPRGTHLALHLAEGENSCRVWVQSFAGSERLNLLDARVRVRGVATASFKRNQLTGFELHANSLEDLEVIEPAPPDPFTTPALPASELWRYSALRSREHRVHVSGVVTLQWSNRMTVIQDATGGVWMDHAAKSDLNVGDQVEAAGFLLQARFGSRLRNAEIRKVGPGEPILPVPIDWREPGRFDHRLVRVTARILDWQVQPEGHLAAAMKSSNVLFIVECPADAGRSIQASFPAGALVSASGVLRLARIDEPGDARMSLFLRSPADLVLLGSPPKPDSRHVVFSAVTAGAGLVAALSLMWLFHRRAVAGITQREQQARAQFEDMQQQLLRSRREREVVVQELHDNIIQSIYSVGLGLDEVRRASEQHPHSVKDRITVAIDSLNALIRDLRSFISGLEPKGIDGPELKGALKSVLLTVGPNEEARFAIQIDSAAARLLSPRQATELFNIAKEAISNCLRHAQAGKASVSLHPHRRGVRLEVMDDGIGFRPDQLDESSMGLRNMRNRARGLGATLDILSAPGQGTKVVVNIPTTAHGND